ncbi:MAG TPA: 50S ribosomal protein L35 [bacterium]|nr:50S ribosomal protein L35 [bacterium]
MKTNRATAKRFSLTASGKIKRKRAGLRHFMRRKSVQAKRKLRNRAYISKADTKLVKSLLPYG